MWRPYSEVRKCLDVGARAMSVNWDRIDKLIYADQILPLVARVVRRRFALERSRLAGKRRDMPHHPLEPLLDQAELAGLISFAEADDFLMVDFVVTGATTSGEEVYIVVEASPAVAVRDVLYAKRMAALFRRVVDDRVEAAVIGVEISAAAAECAGRSDVQFIRME